MCDTKSELKNVFRMSAFDARFLSPNTEVPLPQDVATSITVCIVDASVWYAKMLGTRQRDGAEVVRVFTQPMERFCLLYPNLHTIVLSFDKYRFVTENKSATQQKRAARRAKSAGGSTREVWKWDGSTPIVEVGRLIPPWSDVKANRAAVRQSVREIVDLLCEELRLRDGVHVIFDYEHAETDFERGLSPLVLGANGRTHYATQWHNSYGEADVCCQMYARRMLTRESILIHSIDTDFIPLSLVTLCHTGPARLYLQMNPICYDRVFVPGGVNVKVASTAPGAIRHSEVFDIGEIAATVHAMYSDAVPFEVAVWSFVAFCFTCGNDYVAGIKGVSRKFLFEAFQRTAAVDKPLVLRLGPHPTLVPNHVLAMYYTAFSLHYGIQRGMVTDEWASVSVNFIQSVIANKRGARKALLMGESELVDYFTMVQWCLDYSEDM
jgi:hypothetical protein